MFTRVYAPKIITQAPEARPSSPSVRLTPLLAAAISSITQTTTSTTGSSSHSMSRKKEMNGDAGVTPRSSGNCSEARANRIATKDWPAILALLRRPSERCLLILMKSSAKPTTPSPVNRSEEHTSELQSRQYLVCRLLLE